MIEIKTDLGVVMGSSMEMSIHGVVAVKKANIMKQSIRKEIESKIVNIAMLLIDLHTLKVCILFPLDCTILGQN